MKMTISKLDAAKRQLETAVRLYFSEADPVSIHTLIGAAHTLFADISRQENAPRMLLKDELLDQIKPEYHAKFRKMVNRAQNFFKHADQDARETLDFDPGQSELLLIDCCRQYYRLAGEYPVLCQVYQAWFFMNNQDLFSPALKNQIDRLGNPIPDMLAIGRKRFFEFALSRMADLG